MLPDRDRRSFLWLTAVTASLGALGLVPAAIALPLILGLLGNVWRGWMTIYPYDRILSATSGDGTVWQRERGVRIDVAGLAGQHPGGAYFPCVTTLVDGSWRMYFRGSDVDRIVSARSEDGLRWRLEEGVRVDTGGDPPLVAVSCPRLVPANGSLRMLFTGKPVGTSAFSLFSAMSEDGIQWRREPGVRLDAHALGAGLSIYSFCLLPGAEGRLRMYFEALLPTSSRIHAASSEDGLRWRDDGPVLTPHVNEFGVRSPWIAPRDPDGRWRMYFTAGTKYRSLGTSMFSATSHDGITWHREPGARVRHGGRYASAGLISPCIVARPDGQLRMYYGAYWGVHLLTPLTRWRHAS